MVSKIPLEASFDGTLNELDAITPSASGQVCEELQNGALADVAAGLGAVDWSFTEADTRLPGHDVHPYPAKFIPQIPAGLIARLSAPGETVLDPFGGSGTTALEAVRLGRKAISIDANPLSALIGRVKTAKLGDLTLTALQVHHAALVTQLNGGNLDAAALIARYSNHAPKITNREKWFADTAFAELSLIKARIGELSDRSSRDIALVALSRMVIKASFQDSETRYKSIPRDVPPSETLKRYLREFNTVLASVSRNEAATRYGISQFHCADIRAVDNDTIPDGAADLVVTSPPYGNATDYHLYHRFRLLWLGFDPVALGHIEIGSHLKHQREASGFESYLSDMEAALSTMHRVLKPGRYAALVIGDSVYAGTTYDPAEALFERADQIGFDPCAIIDRPIHAVKRSFAHAGRRATSEHILVLRRKATSTFVMLDPPPYKLWPYEKKLRLREIGLPSDFGDPDATLALKSDALPQNDLKRAVFSHSVQLGECAPEPTWQAILENGGANSPSARKDPKYVTHGLHAYKGKFYPQLAKALLNIANIDPGSTILDPFCGSGTTLLEGYLNGYRAYGCDMNPLAAKIALSKVAILNLDPDVVREVFVTVQQLVANPPLRFPQSLDQIREDCRDEVLRWFQAPVAFKLNWLMTQLRLTSAGILLDFLEIVMSSVVREVSNQEPTDLRVRYRAVEIKDADVLGLFSARLTEQFGRIEKFWTVRGNAPHPFLPAIAIEGDNRSRTTFDALGLQTDQVDLILTSPPYGTALPYIDTDRLSLLLILGLSSSQRRPIENKLIGSREIAGKEKRHFEQSSQWTKLPTGSQKFLQRISNSVVADQKAGFRKRNSPSLLARYLCDMSDAIIQCRRTLRPNGEFMMVIGDNYTTINNEKIRIPCTDLIEEIAVEAGFEPVERIDISVTTDNFKHIKNAIIENVVLRLRSPS